MLYIPSEVLRSRREGKGKYTYAKGEEYEGDWLADRMVTARYQPHPRTRSSCNQTYCLFMCISLAREL